MARVLICHVPKDGGTAREIGAMLMGRGHFVSFDGEPETPRSDRSARLRQFEAVIVIWTEHAIASAGLAAVARETLPLNLLVPLRDEALPVSALPLAFRKLNMFSPRDADGVARYVARLGVSSSSRKQRAEQENQERQRRKDPVVQARMQQPSQKIRSKWDRIHDRDDRDQNSKSAFGALPEVGGGAGPQSRHKKRDEQPNSSASKTAKGRTDKRVTSAAESLLAPSEFARIVDSGLLMVRIPHDMVLNQPSLVEVILGREVLADVERLLHEESRGGTASQSAIETTSISLYGDGFDIERQSERTQFVSAQSGVSQGRWAWLVTPRAPGSGEMILRISALLRDRAGVPTPIALPDRGYDVKVHEMPGLASTA